MNALRQRQRQEVKISSSQSAASQIYDSAPKDLVPLKILDEELVLRVALLDENQLGRLLPDEKFSGFDGYFIFFNRELSAPRGVVKILPQLMAVHVLAKACEVRINCPALHLKDYLPVRLEMLYAKKPLTIVDYERYVEWRKKIERSIFFKNPGWEVMLRHTEPVYLEVMRQLLMLVATHPAVKPSVAEWNKEIRRMERAREVYSGRKTLKR